MLKSFMKDTASYGVVNFATSVISFFVFLIYARYLTVADYGLMSLVTGVVGLLAGILQCGIPNAMQRFYFDKESEKRSIIHSALSLCTVLHVPPVLIAVAAIFLLQGFIPEHLTNASYFLALAIAALPFAAINSLYIELQRLRFDFKMYVTTRFTMLVATLFIPLYLVTTFDKGLEGIYEGSLVGVCLACIGLSILLRKNLKNFSPNKSDISKIFVFGYPFILANIAVILFHMVDKWVITFYYSNVEVGLYFAGERISKIVLFVHIALSMAWTPYVMRLYGEDPRYKEKIVNAFNIALLLIVLASTAICFFAKEIITFALPEDYWSSSNTAIILALSVIGLFSHQFTALGISFEKKTRLIALGWVATTAINIPINFIAIPYLGYIGAAYTTTFCYFFLSGFYLYHSQKLHPLPIKKAPILRAFIIVAISTIIVMWFDAAYADASLLERLCYKTPLAIIVLGLICSSGLIKREYYPEARRLITNCFKKENNS